MKAISMLFGAFYLMHRAFAAEFELVGEMMPIEWRWTAEAISESAIAQEIVGKVGTGATNDFLKVREITPTDARSIMDLVKGRFGASRSPLQISSRVDLTYSAAVAAPSTGGPYFVLIKPVQGEWQLLKEFQGSHGLREKRPPEVFVRFSATNYVRSVEMAERAQREFLRLHPTHPAARSAPSIILQPGGEIAFQFAAPNVDWIWQIKLTADHKFSGLSSNKISAVTRRIEGD